MIDPKGGKFGSLNLDFSRRIGNRKRHEGDWDFFRTRGEPFNREIKSTLIGENGSVL